MSGYKTSCRIQSSSQPEKYDATVSPYNYFFTFCKTQVIPKANLSHQNYCQTFEARHIKAADLLKHRTGHLNNIYL